MAKLFTLLTVKRAGRIAVEYFVFTVVTIIWGWMILLMSERFSIPLPVALVLMFLIAPLVGAAALGHFREWRDS